MLNMEKYKFKFVGDDLNLTFSLSNKDYQIGLSDSINEFVNNEKNKAITSPIDDEVKIIKPTSNNTFNIYFFNTSTSTYQNTYVPLGYNNTNITNSDLSLFTSFYIVQLYDSIKQETQNLLSTNYVHVYNYFSLSTTITRNFSSEDTFFYLKPSDIGNAEVRNYYMKLSFYDAKNGRIIPLYNFLKNSDNTENKFYFDILFLLNDNIYLPPTVTAYQYIDNKFNQLINNTVNSFSNLKPNFPLGSRYNEGSYS